MAELDFLNGTPTAPGETEFDAWLRDRNQKSALRASTVLTAARTVTTPEEVAKRRSVAALAGSVLGTNLPARLLTDPMTLQMVENKVISTRALDTLRKNPLLAEWFSDQDNAAIASTDVEELGLMSQVLYGVARGADKFYDDLVGPGANFRTTAEALSRARDSQRTYTELLAEERAASAGGVEPVGGIAGARVAAQKASGTVPKTTDEDATNPFASARAMKRWLDSRIYGVTSFNDQEDLERDNAEAAREMLREEVERQGDFPIGRGAAEVSRKMAEIPAEAGFLESTKAVFDIMTERPGDFVGFLAGVAAESGISLIAAAGVTAATRNPALGRVAMFGTAVPVVRASNTLEMASEMGYDLSKPEDARRLAQNPSDLERIVDSAGAYATVVSMVDALTAGLGSAMVKNPVGSFAIEAISQAVAGGGGEILARMVSGQQWSWTDAILEGLAEMATAPLEAMGVGSEVVFRKYRESQRASDRRGFFQALSQGSADSALRKRSPEAYKSAIEKLTKDGPVENVYVDAGRMEQLFQDDPEALRALFDAVPDLDYRAFQKAAETGSVFAIPTATYAANIAGTEIDARLTDHLRLRPDRLSYAEAQEAMAETEEQMKGFEKRLKELEETADLDPAAQQEYEDLTTQLIAAGRAPGVARAEAQLLASTVQTMAQRQGVTTAEYVRRNLLPTIRRETSTAEKSPFRVMRMGDLSEALRDPSRATLPEFAAIADELAEQNLTPETASEDDIRLAAISVADRGGLVSSLDEEFLLTPSGIYRATPGEPMMQTVSLRNGTEDLSAWGHTPGKSITTRALALIMQARQRALYGKIKRTDFSQKTVEKMANWMADEIEFELQTPGATAEGWYTTKFQAALDVMTARFPEFDTSVEEFVRPNLPGLKKVSSAYEARQLMTMIIAVTSNGAKVTDNFRMAVDAYRQFRETGRFRDVKNAGDRASSITSHLNRIAQLIGEFDSVSEVQAFLTEDVTVSDLNKQLKAIGMPVLSKMPSDARVPRATAIFGPKLGAFYANLTGADGYLTMDLWWSRTINRYRGDVLPRVSGLKNAVDSKGKPIGLHRFKWLVGQPDLTDSQALKLVVDHAQRYKDRGYTEGDEVEKAANTLYKDAFVKLQETPLSAKERAFMIEVAGAARDEVYARTGKRYSVADIQALIWYYEKRLMADMGAKESGDISYEEAARRAVAGPGGDVFAQGADSGRGQGDGAGVSGAVSEGDGDVADGTILGPGGKPLKLYHGTNREFDKFNDGEIFFTSRRGLANEHALREGATGKPRLVEATVALQNPLEIDAGNVEPDIYWLQNAATIRAAVASGNHDGVMIASGDELMVIAQRADQVELAPTGPLYQGEPGSAAFDAWFRGSKVVAEDGSPLVVYHGTPRPEFEAFSLAERGTERDAGFYGSGFYFTPDRETAEEYAADYEAGAEGRVVEAYVKIENPFYFDLRSADGLRETIEALAAIGVNVRADPENFYTFNLTGDQPIRFTRAAQLAGYDGAVVLRGEEDAGYDQFSEIVAFEPTQVKSVSNRGTFDPDDPRILYQGDPANAPATPDDFAGELMLSTFRKKGWFIASATQSHFGDWSSAENVAEAERMRQWLKDNNLPYQEVRGRYAGVDDGPSFLVFADETTYGATARNMFRQESILTRQGFVYSPYEERKPVPITGLRMGEALDPDEDYQTTLPDGRTFTLDLDWPDPKSDDPRDDLALREDGKVELIHWSPKERATIDPKHAGKGKMDGPERHRSGPNKAFYGLNIGVRNTAYRRESPALGGIKHTVAIDPSRLYPWDTDPDGLRAKIDGKLPAAQQIGAYEKAIKKAGYAGYFVIDGPLGDVAAVFEALPVEKVEVDTALYQSDEAFFKSALAEAIRDAKQETAPVKDWLKIIPKMPGVKKAELEWTGLTSWLESQDPDRKMTRHQIYHWLSSELVQIERVDGSGAFASYTTSLAAGKVEKDTLYDEILLTVPNLDEIGPNAGKEIASTVANSGHFVTPNIVVHARVQATEDTLFIDEVQSDLNSFWRKRGGQAQALAPVPDEVKAEVAQYAEIRASAQEVEREAERARSQLYDAISVAFTFAGVRVTHHAMDDALYSSSRTIETLAKTPDENTFDAMLGLLLQRQVPALVSDLNSISLEAQAEIGRAARGAVAGDLIGLVKDVYQKREARSQARERERQFRRDMSPQARDAWEGGGSGTLPLPLTPFEGESAITLAMKYLTTYAARAGFKKIAWTPGYMQMKRWGVQEQRAQGMIQRWVVTGGRDDGTRILTLMLDNGQVIDISYDTAGVVTRVPPAWAQLNAEGRNLREIVPQAMADIAMRPIPEGETIVAGDGADLPEVNISDNAGQGYRIVYDQQMKRFLEKWAGKFGGKVESDVSVTRDTGEASLGPRVAAYREEWRNREGAGLSADSVRRFINAAEDFGMATEGAVREMRIAYDSGDYGRAVDLVFRRLTKRGVRQVAQQIGDSAFFPDEGQPVWSITLTDEFRAEASKPQPLFQGRPTGARGQIILPPAGSDAAPEITLFDRADLSTVIHEGGHWMLWLLQTGANAGDQFSSESMETVKAWLASQAEDIAAEVGLIGPQVLEFLANGTTGAADVDAAVHRGIHERFARGFEAYMREGKAPSIALRGVFHRFAAWLMEVYRNAKKLRVELSDEVRQVFDKMIATDAQIAQARQLSVGAEQIAATARAMGLDEASYEELVRLQDEERAEAFGLALRETLAPIMAQRSKEMRALRAELTKKISAEVNAQRHNRAFEWLANGRWSGVADVPDDLPADLRMDPETLGDEYGQDVLDKLPRGRRPMTKIGGITADEAAGWFGYDSGAEMLRDLSEKPRARDEIKQRVQAALAEHIEAQDPRDAAEATADLVDALHGEKHGQVLAAELRAINRISNRKRAITSRQQAAQIARDIIARTPVREAVRADLHARQAQTFGEQAARLLVTGDTEGAFEAKRKQLIQHSLFVESRKAADLMAKAERKAAQLKRPGTRKNLAGEYLEAIDDLLYTYDFRKISAAAEKKRGGLLRYIEMMVKAGRENELAIPDHVITNANRTPYKTLTVQRLQGVLDALTNIEHTARLKKKLLDRQRERDMDAVVADIQEAFDENVKGVDLNRVPTGFERVRDAVKEYVNYASNADTLLRRLDGWKLGDVYRHIKSGIDRASSEEVVMRLRAGAELDKLFDGYSRGERRRMAVRQVWKGYDQSLSKWDLISIALNSGNKDNWERMTSRDNPHAISPAQAKELLSNLDERDWKFVQSVWDHLDAEYWPQIAAREKRTTGVVPKKVEAMFMVSDIPNLPAGLTGGYYPIVYDRRFSAKVAEEKHQEIQTAMQAGRFGKAQTRNGHTKERAAGSGGRTVELGIHVLFGHVHQVIHDLALSEEVANSWKILQDPRVRGMFERAGLLTDLASLEVWLQDTAAGQIVAAGVLGRMARHAKSGFTVSKLAFNMSTVAIQFTGLVQSAAFLGKRDLVKGYSSYVAQGMYPAAQRIKARSVFMAERERTFQRDMFDLIGETAKTPISGSLADARDLLMSAGFWAMQKVQFYVVDVPTWMAAHGQARKRGMTEDEAVHYADRAVARAQASGVYADRTAIERGTLGRDTRQNEFLRLFTALGSYMFAKFNIAQEIVGRTRRDVADPGKSSIAAVLNGTIDMLLLFTVEAVLYHMIKGTLPGDDEDEDEQSWLAFLASQTALSAMGTLPFIRDMVSVIQGFDGGGAYGGVLETVGKPLVQIGQGEVDKQLMRSINDLVGLAVPGYPSTAIWRLADAEMERQSSGNFSPLDYIMGVPR